MAEKPSDLWRRRLAEEATGIATGTLAPEHAYTTQLFPESLVTATGTTLDSFETGIRALGAPSDDEILVAVQRVVLALNAVNEAHGGVGYETVEREMLCEYIDQTLTENGVDVAALAERNGLERYEITDEWREW
ncbi:MULTISPECIES: hypothetical protein [unclassified Streptomyces]|uniref:hypothetical protein n=1 Tax=unclassified Streptomyces TaxID=2593676 RepID=UPI002DDB9E92|nr:hypothetical protein [Streptomyces sp. NBC_01237]WRZ74080.1 hypothetical protein OG251_22025 [Streptomyces sp. NBC_01237]